MNKNRSFILGVVLLGMFLLIALFAPWIAPYSPLEQDLLSGLVSPNQEHWMGRDLLGRDVFSRVLYGTQVSLTVGVLAISVSAAIGISVGAIAGSSGGRTDEFIMRIIDVVLAFPGILLAIAIMAVLGPGLGNVILALCLTGWVGFARLTRAQFLSLRERDFVLAAVASGATQTRVVFHHLLPNASAPLLIEATFGMASVIVAEAGLSFLGLGVQPPAPSWGVMLNEGRAFLLTSPYLTAFPGLCLMLLVLAINLVGDGLRDMLDPKLR